MKLRFAKGAIVRFAFSCKAEGKVAAGKVLDVTEDEVIICPQIAIYKPNSSFGFSQMIDVTRSMDSNREFHIDRNIIVGWEYDFLYDDCVYCNAVTPEEVDTARVNYYGISGFCRGSGENFE